jgi:hypothetical protein
VWRRSVEDRQVELAEPLRLGPANLDCVVDRSWGRPVTVGVRLFSLADDLIRHASWGAYVRGLLV